MKKIKYRIPGYTGIYNPETDTVENVACLTEAEKPYSLINEEAAKAEAYNGAYTVEDDADEPADPTQEERIAELEEALDLLLSGVTE